MISYNTVGIQYNNKIYFIITSNISEIISIKFFKIFEYIYNYLIYLNIKVMKNNFLKLL